MLPWALKQSNKADVCSGLEGTGEASVGDKYAGDYPHNIQAALEHMIIYCCLYFKGCNKMR